MRRRIHSYEEEDTCIGGGIDYIHHSQTSLDLEHYFREWMGPAEFVSFAHPSSSKVLGLF